MLMLIPAGAGCSVPQPVKRALAVSVATEPPTLSRPQPLAYQWLPNAPMPTKLSFGIHNSPQQHNLTLLCYNAEFLHHKNNFHVNPPKNDQARQHLAHVLATSKADVIMLQEVEGPQALAEFVNHDLNPVLDKQQQSHYQMVCFTPLLADEGYTIQRQYVPLTQAFLFRKPLSLDEAVTEHNGTLPSLNTAEPMLKRELLLGKFSLTLPNGQKQPLWLLNLHFKANGMALSGTDTLKEFITSTQRLREAYAVQRVLKQHLSSYEAANPKGPKPWVVVGGDTNSDKAMASGASILEALAGEQQRTHHCLYNVETDTLTVPEERLSFPDFRLHPDTLLPVHLTDVIPATTVTCHNEHYGRPFPNRKLDVLMVNDEALDGAKPSYVPLSTALPDVSDTVLRGASDHDPLIMSFKLPEGTRVHQKAWTA
jgi:hypothetical protein